MSFPNGKKGVTRPGNIGHGVIISLRLCGRWCGRKGIEKGSRESTIGSSDLR